MESKQVKILSDEWNFNFDIGELRVAELQTSDGYLIHPKDYISDVLTDGERIVALDYDEYIKKQEQ